MYGGPTCIVGPHAMKAHMHCIVGPDIQWVHKDSMRARIVGPHV